MKSVVEALGVEQRLSTGGGRTELSAEYASSVLIVACIYTVSRCANRTYAHGEQLRLRNMALFDAEPMAGAVGRSTAVQISVNISVRRPTPTLNIQFLLSLRCVG